MGLWQVPGSSPSGSKKGKKKKKKKKKLFTYRKKEYCATQTSEWLMLFVWMDLLRVIWEANSLDEYFRGI